MQLLILRALRDAPAIGIGRVAMVEWLTERRFEIPPQEITASLKGLAAAGYCKLRDNTLVIVPTDEGRRAMRNSFAWVKHLREVADETRRNSRDAQIATRIRQMKRSELGFPDLGHSHAVLFSLLNLSDMPVWASDFGWTMLERGLGLPTDPTFVHEAAPRLLRKGYIQYFRERPTGRPRRGSLAEDFYLIGLAMKGDRALARYFHFFEKLEEEAL